MLQFWLFNVRHGFCALAIGPNATNTLFDCGHDDETGFRPSRYLPLGGIDTINRMVLGNFDTDHASDLHNLKDAVNIQHFVRNRTLDPDQLRFLKMQGGPISSGIKTAIEMHGQYVHPNIPIDYAGVELTTFWNSYPEFTDTNNLSVVSFLQYGGSSICVSGDLEREGWERLLLNADFRRHLSLVDIFIASHHGRISGYCEEVFDYCKPSIILVSDKEMVYESQICDYAQHATGITWNASNTNKRYVLTTRCDGNLLITKRPNEGFFIQAGINLDIPKTRSASSF